MCVSVCGGWVGGGGGGGGPELVGTRRARVKRTNYMDHVSVLLPLSSFLKFSDRVAKQRV